MSFPSEDQLINEVNAFAESISGQRERWEYCLDRISYVYVCRDGMEIPALDERSFSACDRVIGCYSGTAKSRLLKLHRMGWDAAQEQIAQRTWLATRPYFYCGPMQSWNVGHVYFARLRSHPHVVKIGFSRRVRERLDDIQAKTKSLLMVPEVGLEVGTLIDEHRWHRNNASHRISGEWFFDPSMADRSLPSFLAEPNEEAA